MHLQLWGTAYVLSSPTLLCVVWSPMLCVMPAAAATNHLPWQVRAMVSSSSSSSYFDHRIQQQAACVCACCCTDSSAFINLSPRGMQHRSTTCIARSVHSLGPPVCWAVNL